MEYGFLTLLPPIIAILLAIRTKQVIISLTFGLFIGWTIISSFNPFLGLLATIEGFVGVFKNEGNTRTVIFTLLIGVLIQLIKSSGGIEGFIQSMKVYLGNSSNNKNKIQVGAALTGFLIFIESNISILTVGTIFQPLFNKYGISKAKLAYIADSSSAPSCILFPVNAWGAYIIGLLSIYEGIAPFSVLVSSIAFNLYPILTLIFVFFIASSNKSFGAMKKYENREVIISDKEESVSDGDAKDMVLPLLAMIISMPVFLIYTGWTDTEGHLIDNLWNAISNASGSSAVLYAVSLGIIFTVLLYGIKGKITIKSFISTSFKGMNEMLEMAILMVMAFSLGALCKELGTGEYVAFITKSWLSPAFAPALLFLISCFIAFSTGTSWGTFAIMISIAVPLAQQLDMNISLAVAAVLGGGVFGDHCSPISDTTLIASMASGVDHIDHVRTQLPYALFTGSLAFILYLIVGFTM